MSIQDVAKNTLGVELFRGIIMKGVFVVLAYLQSTLSHVYFMFI